MGRMSRKAVMDTLAQAQRTGWPADLFGANLRGRDLGGLDFSRTKLNDANLAGSDLTGCIFRGTTLNSADLTGCIVKNANFQGASLIGANLTGVDFKQARNIQGMNLLYANLQGTQFGEARVLQLRMQAVGKGQTVVRSRWSNVPAWGAAIIQYGDGTFFVVVDSPRRPIAFTVQNLAESETLFPEEPLMRPIISLVEEWLNFESLVAAR